MGMRQRLDLPPAVEGRGVARHGDAQAADDHGLEHIALLSGAGHDAQEIAALCPTAMIFVRGEYDGISHNPREY
ncbi:hypothetical protein [Streptomyces sp. SD15]